MSTTPTVHYALLKIDPFTEIDTWGPIYNGTLDKIDTQMFDTDTAVTTAHNLAVSAQNTADKALPIAGGVMTGDIVLKGDATSAMNPTTLQQVNSIISGATVSSADITDATAAGRAILTAADASVQRTDLDVDQKGMISGVDTKAASFDFALTDRGFLVENNTAGDIIGTIRLNSVVAFPILTRIDLIQAGAGSFTIAVEAGVTLQSKGTKTKLNGQFSGATLLQKSSNVWYLIGDLA